MKSARQQKILEILAKYDIDTQDALIKKLEEQGFEVTQTTVSRDINQLKLVKAVTANGSYKYIIPSVDKDNSKAAINSALVDAVSDIIAAKNIVVVKTLAGMANAIAVCVDSLAHESIVGSVAGDDTIIIVTHDDDIALSMVTDLKTAFGIK